MASRAEPLVLSLVERGWQAARECSLDLDRAGVQTIHYVKGHLSQDVCAMIAPKPHIRVVDLPRRLFWWGMWPRLTAYAMTGAVRSVLVDNERSYRRLQRWFRWTHINIVLVRPAANGYEFWNGLQPIGRTVWYEMLGIHASCADL